MPDSKFANTFLVGADPEMVLLDPPQLINGMTGLRNNQDTSGYFGFDHGGYVVEPHPKPDVSVRVVCNNIRTSLDYVTAKFGAYKFRAGAALTCPQRTVTLGGHVHLDLPRLSAEQIRAMDVFHKTLVGMDILPHTENEHRKAHGYGNDSDVRAEHGHVEYRSMCSWLFSRRTAMLCMTGIKLAAVAPDTLPTRMMTSVKSLQAWFESFQDKDDDARWIIERGYFSKSLEAKPDNELKEIWKSSATRGEELVKAWVDEQARKTQEAVRLNEAMLAPRAGIREQAAINPWDLPATQVQNRVLNAHERVIIPRHRRNTLA